MSELVCFRCGRPTAGQALCAACVAASSPTFGAEAWFVPRDAAPLPPSTTPDKSLNGRAVFFLLLPSRLEGTFYLVSTVLAETGETTMTTIKTYAISNVSSGHSLGQYEAASPEEAIAAMLADAGCDEEPSEALVATEVAYWLTDINTTERIRLATPEEVEESYSRSAGPTGAISVDGRTCYVEGNG